MGRKPVLIPIFPTFVLETAVLEKKTYKKISTPYKPKQKNVSEREFSADSASISTDQLFLPFPPLRNVAGRLINAVELADGKKIDVLHFSTFLVSWCLQQFFFFVINTISHEKNKTTTNVLFNRIFLSRPVSEWCASLASKRNPSGYFGGHVLGQINSR